MPRNWRARESRCELELLSGSQCVAEWGERRFSPYRIRLCEIAALRGARDHDDYRVRHVDGVPGVISDVSHAASKAGDHSDSVSAEFIAARLSGDPDFAHDPGDRDRADDPDDVVHGGQPQMELAPGHR